MCSYEVTANDEVSGSKTIEKLLSHLEELIFFNIYMNESTDINVWQLYAINYMDIL